MAGTKLTLIKGGLSDDNNKYISGYVTDTGLMGVICMGLDWKTPEGDELHQLFYFETEEYGFDDYEGIWNLDIQAIAMAEMRMMGGLGGRCVDISKNEALYLLNKYVDYNRSKNLPLPEGEKEYRFMIGRVKELPPEDLRKLKKKIYKKIENVYELINYFLMRSFGGDKEGAEYLGEDVDLSVFDRYAISTLYKNTIDETEFDDVYRCESVIEKDGQYRIVITEIGVSMLEVIGAEVVSEMRISDYEAGMILTKNEFITVYDIKVGKTVMQSILSSMAVENSVTDFDKGYCYVRYNEDNGHVKRRVYWLNEDVFGLFFVNRIGQMVVCAYHEEYIIEIEKMLDQDVSYAYLEVKERYEFGGQVMLDYMHSDVEDFNEYVKEYIEE